ncbi:MAG: Omp28-related outer membrane protein [Bacteroidales bacterium]|jgi:hypothetical protein|nr:Omp28-related outer membrane protein [Bacteroidales bacterium]
MKNLIFITVFIVSGLIVSAQTFVDTTASNRNVIIEQFTYKNAGIYLTDPVINNLMSANKGRVWGINIREGSNVLGMHKDFSCKDGFAFIDYFNPDYNPDSNNDIDIIPGMINRGNMEKRSHWNSSASDILLQPSCLNVAAQGNIDWELRQLSITVEVYYTGNSNTSENYLTVALLQNNLEKKEGLFYEDMLPNGNYNHLRVLRDIISERWGDTIAQTTQGSFFTKTYIYAIPDTIESGLSSDFDGMFVRPKVLLEDLEVIVFVSESKTNIISGNKAEIAHVNIPDRNLRVELYNIKEHIYNNKVCGDNFPVYLTIKNIGNDTIHSIEYSILKDSQTIFQNQLWDSRSIYPFTTDTITTNIPLEGGIESLISVKITKINESDTLIMCESMLTHHLVENTRGFMTLVIAPDQWASMVYFSIYDADDNRLFTNLYDPWPNLPRPGTIEYRYDIYPEKIGCYTFLIRSNINRGYGEGYFKLLAEDGTVLMYNDGKNCEDLFYFFNVIEAYNGIQKLNKGNIIIFPNPAHSQFTVTNIADANLRLYNMLGQEILSINSSEENTTISVDFLPQGMYVLKVAQNKDLSVYKIHVVR